MLNRKIYILKKALTNKPETWLMIHYNPKARLRLRKAKKQAHKSRMRNG